MKNTSVILSTYTADVSGVCSALYELSGMVVIHDPSGCNSTYNTHDEPRWYDQDSLIFISGLSEIDAIMGSDDKLIEDITRAVRQLKPRFIALVQTPVPMMTGVDFYGIRDILTRKTGLPVFYFPTTGMRSYIQGVNMALNAVASSMVGEVGNKKEYRKDSGSLAQTPAPDSSRHISGLKVNLLGVTPLDFSVNSTLSSVKAILEEAGFVIWSCFAMESSPEEIRRAGEADVNLLLSSAGYEAAETLGKRFGIPYAAGFPCGLFAKQVIRALKKCVMTGENVIVYRDWSADPDSASPGRLPEEFKTAEQNYLIGEAVISQSIREALRLEFGLKVRVLCCLDTPGDLLDRDSLFLPSEEEIREQLHKADLVIADPMFRPVCSPSARFIPLAHEAFSGRIYRDRIPDLTKAGDILYNS